MADPTPAEILTIADKLFAFRVGDTVKLKGSAPGEVTRVEPGIWPGSRVTAADLSGCIGVITERFLQQCHADYQRLYRIHWVRANGEGHFDTGLHPEVALEPAVPWSQRASIEKLRHEEAAIEQAERGRADPDKAHKASKRLADDATGGEAGDEE